MDAGCDPARTRARARSDRTRQQRRLLAGHPRSALRAVGGLDRGEVPATAPVLLLAGNLYDLSPASLSLVLLLAATGMAGTTGKATLVLATLGLSGIIFAGGGLPFANGRAGRSQLPIEAFRVTQRRSTIGWGLVALRWRRPAAGAARDCWLGPASQLSAWHWLAPALYAGAAFCLRLKALQQAKPAGPQHRYSTTISWSVLSGAVLSIGPNGDIQGATARTEAVLGLAPEILVEGGLFDRIRFPTVSPIVVRCPRYPGRARRARTDRPHAARSRQGRDRCCRNAPALRNGTHSFCRKRTGPRLQSCVPPTSFTGCGRTSHAPRRFAGSTEIAKGRVPRHCQP